MATAAVHVLNGKTSKAGAELLSESRPVVQ
jgi:hypothetical protein